MLQILLMAFVIKVKVNVVILFFVFSMYLKILSELSYYKEVYKWIGNRLINNTRMSYILTALATSSHPNKSLYECNTISNQWHFLFLILFHPISFTKAIYF